MATPAESLSTEALKKRILDEELYRVEIRKALEEKKQDDVTESPTWKILNSNLVIVVVTSIFVTGFGTWLTWLHQSHAEKIQTQRLEKKLLAEFDLRLVEIRGAVAEVKRTTNDGEKGSYLMYAYYAARGTPEYQPTWPEFKGTHMAGLVIQLDSLGISKGAADAIAATVDLDTGVEIKDGKQWQAAAPALPYRLLSSDRLDLAVKRLQAFRDAAWQKMYAN
jgi:hypothetical protein